MSTPSNHYRDLMAYSLSQFAGGYPSASSGSATNFNVRGSTAELGIRFVMPTAGTIESVFLILANTTATASDDLLVAQIRASSDVLANISKAGSTVYAAEYGITHYTTIRNVWMEFNFSSPYYGRTGEMLWFTVGNSAGVPGTYYPSFRIAAGRTRPTTTAGSAWGGQNGTDFQLASTVNNWSSTTITDNWPSAFVKLADGRCFGAPFYAYVNTGFAAFLSTTNERGLLFRTGSVRQALFGVGWEPSYTLFNRLTIRNDEGNSTLGSTVYSYSFDRADPGPSLEGSLGLHIFDSPVFFEPNSTYRIVLGQPGAANTRPSTSYFPIESVNGSSLSALQGLYPAVGTTGNIGAATEWTGTTWFDKGIEESISAGLTYAVCPDMVLFLADVPETPVTFAGGFAS